MKDTILQKSQEMFLRQGFKTVGMDDIANALHISKKTIYQNFKSKDDLVKATLNHIYHSVFGRIYEVVGKCESPIHEHFEIKKSVDDFLGKEMKKSVCMFQLKKYYPELHHQFEKKKYKDQKILLHKNLKEGVDKGFYRKEIDLDFVSTQFIAGGDSYHLDEEFSENDMNDFSLEKFDKQFLEYYLRAIVTEKGLEILEHIIKKK